LDCVGSLWWSTCELPSAFRKQTGKYDVYFLRFQNEIKAHDFFSSINWDDLEQKKIPPPFTPNVSSCYDISNFDPEFTDESVPNSICWSQDLSIVNASVMEADDAFVGFSYAPASDDSFL
ncbi:serine/threonine-protein kinase Sgk3-like, partial [Gymnodraco acuticeps]|uniref:Serine/threonine-protein kinase Sgk3-like n=1 Tax=Gymnodraco acuticeps TaxID=8218 RepID=A0A6P8W1S9_GYMAC